MPKVALTSQPKWLGSTVLYEGLPMALRVRVNADTTENRKRFPHLVTVIHTFTAVRMNGLPDPTYNDQLLELDLAIVASLDHGGSGIAALIETFHGSRTYYAYAASKLHGRDALAAVRRVHSGQKLSVSSRPDPGWDLLKHYRNLFPW